MKITLISHNYNPEDSGIGLYSTELAEYLAENNSVNVITAFPYYPQWEIFKEYQSLPVNYQEEINGVKVRRYKMYTPHKPNFFRRVWQMISFLKGSIKNIRSIDEADVVIVVVPFTISIILGIFLKKRTGAKLWIHVQDFEFDAAKETGLLSKTPGAFRFLKWMEKKLFQFADQTSSISFAMLEKLRFITNQEPVYFPNWINPNAINPAKSNGSPIFDQRKFNILYSGNIGAKQDWTSFINVVKQTQNKNWHYTIIGDGAMRREVEEALIQSPNVSFLDPVKYEDLNDILCSADVHILTQKSEVVDTVMPSKILGMMASAKPSLITGNKKSEVAQIFKDANAGFYLSNSTENQIIEKLNTIATDHILANKMGKSARAYIIDRFSAEKVLLEFELSLKTL